MRGPTSSQGTGHELSIVQTVVKHWEDQDEGSSSQLSSSSDVCKVLEWGNLII